MKKRVKSLLLCAATALTVGAFATACEEELPHVHTYSEEWTADAEGHFHQATCDDAEDEAKQPHVDKNNDGACDICEYTDHTHTYSEDWTVDCTNHWHAADCGHTVAGADVSAHVDENEDGECDVCKYVIEDIHEHYFDSKWTSDESYHWHAALCEHKGEIDGKAAHELNAAGDCTVCGEHIQDVDVNDIEAVLAAAGANNNKVVSGSVYYTLTIPDMDYIQTVDVYYVLGNGYAYVNRYQYEMASETWYQSVGVNEEGENEVFGVITYDAGATLEAVEAGPEHLNGYEYAPSTILGSKDSSTLVSTLSALYEFSKEGTAKNVVVSYDEETGVYSFSYEYLSVQTITGNESLEDSGNDDATGDTVVNVVTNLFVVEAKFTVDENFVINEAEFEVGAYNQDIDGDYTYDVESGTYTMSEGALADTYNYVVAQTSGERIYTTAYPKESLVPYDFELALPDGTVSADEIKVEVGTYTTLSLVDLKPFSAQASFINPEDFVISVVNKEAPEAETFSPFYSTFGGCIGFNPTAEGEYTMTITYGDLVKAYTLIVTPATPTAIKAYAFEWIQGYDSLVYTADEYNPGPTTKISVEPGETFDFAVMVSPNKAEQKWNISVDSTNATLSKVTLENVVVFYEQAEEYEAYQFKADVAGTYTITMTSTVDSTITNTLVVYVGVEEEVQTSATYNLIVSSSDFGKSEEVTFEVPVDGTYEISATEIPAGVWFQMYNATEDSWSQIQNNLPYSVDCVSGDEITLRLFTSMSTASEDRGTTVTVEVAPSTGGSEEGGEGSEEPTSVTATITENSNTLTIAENTYVYAEVDKLVGDYTVTWTGAGVIVEVNNVAVANGGTFTSASPRNPVVFKIYGTDYVAVEEFTLTITAYVAPATELALDENTITVTDISNGTSVSFTATEAGTYTFTAGANAVLGYNYSDYGAGASFSVELAEGESVEFVVLTENKEEGDVVVTVAKQ